MRSLCLLVSTYITVTLISFIYISTAARGTARRSRLKSRVMIIVQYFIIALQLIACGFCWLAVLSEDVDHNQQRSVRQSIPIDNPPHIPGKSKIFITQTYNCKTSLLIAFVAFQKCYYNDPSFRILLALI